MTAMDVAAAARAAAQQRPPDRWAAEFANMSLRDHPAHMSRFAHVRHQTFVA